MVSPIQRPKDPLSCIFAYRAIDLRDRFPQPLETFREALECLQSDRSYMAALSGEIIAYLRGGCALTIPDYFFLRRSGEIDATLVLPEHNDDVCKKVEAWLRVTLIIHKAELSKSIPLEDRPFSLDQLLEQCDITAPQHEEIKAWQEMPDIGRELLGGLGENDVWEKAERVFDSYENAQKWMRQPLKQLEGRSPEEVLPSDIQRVYDLLVRLESDLF
ncbi:MbcA/ParS/Xre antitoxin family protein [Halomonas sp. JS92-SW72]|uniref:MbcA/ParS/Xre antitoxin family protein n=1 Tax=Halomonas sp. JS92-SW72 TaxID=2306583 RepID=UPI000E5B738B|nr:MbcA/ParS/Xre antitoxin family protein [Halomonas sp. JS92-SW72]AXY44054.1 DUF2384 domain-containing protein [Halomonas sp. JS92-SW72]